MSFCPSFCLSVPFPCIFFKVLLPLSESVVFMWSRSKLIRVFRGGAGPRWVGWSTVGQAHGEYGVPRWGRFKVSRVFLLWGRFTMSRMFHRLAGPWWVGCSAVGPIHDAGVPWLGMSSVRRVFRVDFFLRFLYPCYHPHTPRDSLSPVFRVLIFFHNFFLFHNH